MLDPNAISVAVALAQEYGGRGISLTPIQDTALSMICREVPCVAPDAQSANYEGLTTHLVDLSRGEAHAGVMAHAVELASGAVRRTLDFTRNTVNPHIRQVIEKYKVIMADNETAPLPYDLDSLYLPEVFKLAPGRDFVEQWENSPKASSPGLVNFGSYSPEEIISLSKLTDDGDFNSSMQELLSAKDGEGLRMIAEVLDGRMDVERIPAEYTLPLAVVVKNIEMPKEGLQTTLASYNNARSLVSNIAALRALTVIRLAASNGKNLSLYRTVGSVNPSVISVNGEVYTDMLERGFSLEALVGNEILGRKYRGAQLLEAEVLAELKDAYLGDRARRTAAHNLNRKVISRKAVQTVLRDDIARIRDENAFVVEGDTYDKAWGRLRGFIDEVYKNEFQTHEPIMVIAAAVCLVWYAHTDAARVIDIMFTIEMEQPELPQKEVATLATLEYLCAWVVSQLNVSVPQS